MPTVFQKAAARGASSRLARDSTSEQSVLIKAELAALHVASSFSAPSSHLYHEAHTTLPRPPQGTELPWGSPLRHVSGGQNRLGAPQLLPAPALALTRDGFALQESVRAIMARGGASATAVLPADAELRLLEESKGSLADRAALTQGTAAEIMSRDTCVRCQCPSPLLLVGTSLPQRPLTCSPHNKHPTPRHLLLARSVNFMLKLTAEKPINSTHRVDYPLHPAETYRDMKH